jgi:hypothetical protein
MREKAVLSNEYEIQCFNCPVKCQRPGCSLCDNQKKLPRCAICSGTARLPLPFTEVWSL